MNKLSNEVFPCLEKKSASQMEGIYLNTSRIQDALGTGGTMEMSTLLNQMGAIVGYGRNSFSPGDQHSGATLALSN